MSFFAKLSVPVTGIAALAALFLAPALHAQTNQSFVTAFTPSAVRNNYSGFVGMQFTVGSSPITVTALGRMNPGGFGSGIHTLKLVNAQTAVDLPGASVQLQLAFTRNGDAYNYAALPAPIVLQANTSYRLLSQETAATPFTNADNWYDLTPVTTTAIANVTGGVYTDAAGNQVLVPGSAGYGYGPVTFLYGSANPAYPPPSVSVLNSPGAQTPTTFIAQAASSLGSLASVQFQLNGQNYGAPATLNEFVGLFTLSVPNNSLLNDLSYSLTAVATDAFGGSATSAPVIFTYIGTDQLLLTGQTLGPLRNNYGNQYGHFVGLEFTVGSQPLDVYQLARYVAPGSSQSHLVKLVNAATGIDVPGGSVTIALAGVPAGQFAYGYFASPIVLAANTAYYLVSQETIGGDSWYDIAPVTPGVLGTVNGGVYQGDSGAFTVVKNTTNYSYVPVNLGAAPIPGPYNITVATAALTKAVSSGAITVGVTVTAASTLLPLASVQLDVDGQPFGQPNTANLSTYQFVLDTTQLSNGPHTLSAIAIDVAGDAGIAPVQTFVVSNTTVIPTTQPFITSFQGTVLRNDFSGFVGLEFTTGASPVAITSLGRYCAATNNGSHTVKLVQVTTLTDVPGGSVSLSMAGCTAGQFVYAPLAATLNLPANSIYYLASQETGGGDLWYDYSPVTTAAAGTSAAVIDAVYYANGLWITVPGATYPNPAATSSSSYVPLNFLLTTINGNSTLSVTEALANGVVTAAPVSSGKILGVQFQIDGFNIYSEVTSPPYTLTVPSLNYGGHSISAIARDSLGNTAASTPLEDDSVCYPCALAVLQRSSIAVEPIIAFSPAAARNDYTGWVGFQFTLTGPLPTGLLQVSCIGGATQGHLIKFVDASTGLDVPGGAMWVTSSERFSFQGCLIPLAGSLTVGKSYYLVMQQTSGGDPWYDVSPAVPVVVNIPEESPTYVPHFTIDGPVYWNGSSYVLVPTPNYSYVGLEFAGFVVPI